MNINQLLYKIANTYTRPTEDSMPSTTTPQDASTANATGTVQEQGTATTNPLNISLQKKVEIKEPDTNYKSETQKAYQVTMGGSLAGNKKAASTILQRLFL